MDKFPEGVGKLAMWYAQGLIQVSGLLSYSNKDKTTNITQTAIEGNSAKKKDEYDAHIGVVLQTLEISLTPVTWVQKYD